MKKKVKLFTTIASLCLAVALMAFGVYAAQNVTVDITGSVTFEAAAHVNTTITLSSTLENIKAEEGGLAEVTDAAVYSTPAGDISTGAATGSYAIGANTINPTKVGTNMVYTYTVKIVNNAKASDAYAKLKVTVTASSDFTATPDLATDGYTLVLSGDLATATTMDAKAEKTFVVTLTVDSTRTLGTKDIGVKIALEAVNA